MIAMNIFPVGLRDEDPKRQDYTFGIVVQELAVEAEDVVSSTDPPWAFLAESVLATHFHTSND